MSVWTDERVEETVTSAYVHSQLRPNEQDLLQRTLYFGGDLTDDTYLDWILTRARRFFLILVATGVPDQIFGVVDDSYDDEDLPISEHAVPDLRLSYQPDRTLDKRFYKNQFRYLTRIVGEGEHIRYADEETVPISTLSLKSVVLSDKEGTDKVQLPFEKPKTLIRQRIALKPPLTEDEILHEIAASRRLCHEHVTSVFGSYLHQGLFNVLSVPAAEWTLKSFLTDTPKVFSALSKTDRRQTLINWPHCLANALSWLHRNGEYHGAIRPSNIHIDDGFRIFLGLLEGDGFLRDKVKSDDIEAYQYAPPERWKRAVTVQNTGTADVTLPSGGRSVRRSSKTDKSDTKSSIRSRSIDSSTRYTFQPTSRGSYARLRLSTAIGETDSSLPPTSRGRSMRSRAETKSISTQGTSRSGGFDPGVPAVPPLPPVALPPMHPAPPARAPSVMSSNSSNGNRTGSTYSFPLFVAAPEGRSAVVQTWKSVESDMFASDMFSLGAVIIDILNLLVKRSYGSFSRHRASKNRMAGRGGGLADASFHANLGQVHSWAQSLQAEAAKKVNKDPSQVYHSVGPVISLALQCLDREPASRMVSEQLEKKLDEYIHRFAGISRLHCSAEKVKEKEKKESKKENKEINTIKEERTVVMPVREMNSSNRAALTEPTSPDHSLQVSTEPARLASPLRRHLLPSEHQSSIADSDIVQSPLSHTSRSATTMSGSYSVSSHPSTSVDGRSETVVAESPRSREQSVRRPSRRREPGVLHEDIPWAGEQESAKTLYWHKNDSEVDPRLSFGGSVDTGAFTYLNYSPSASSEEGVKYFPRPPSDPPPLNRPPPNRELPPLPPMPTKVRSAKPKRRVRAAKPSENDVAMLSQLSNAATGGHPLRIDSLPKTLDHVEDYHDAIRHTRRPHTPRNVSVSPTSKP